MEVDFVSVMKAEETRIGGELSADIDECLCSSCGVCDTLKGLRQEIQLAKETVESLETKNTELNNLVETKKSSIESSRQRIEDISQKTKRLYEQYFSLKAENEKLEKQANELGELVKNRERCMDYQTKKLNKITADYSILSQQFFEAYMSQRKNQPGIVDLEGESDQSTSNSRKRRRRRKSSQYPSKVSMKSASVCYSSIDIQSSTNKPKSRKELSTNNSPPERHEKTNQSSKFITKQPESDKLECPVCMKRLPSMFSLISHQRIHSKKKISQIRHEMVVKKGTSQLSSQVKKLQCSMCSKICRSPAGLVHHQKTHSRQQGNSFDWEDKSCKSKANELECPICSKVCRNATGLAHHRRSHFEGQRKEIVSEGSELQIIPHQESQELQSKISLQSEIVDTNFDYHQKMEENQQNNRNSDGMKNKKYQCKMCTKAFCSPSQLCEHENIHKGIKPYECEICSKSFSYRASAYTHSLTHSRFKGFQCSQCKYAFTQRAHLRRHMSVHQRNRSHKCDLCGASFGRQYLLNIHYRRIHSHQVQPMV